MKTSTQIFIDKHIVKPIAYLLNFLVRLLGKILSIDHDLNKNFETIAVSKFKGMGSIIQATPMLKELRGMFPKAEIIFVSTKANQAVLSKIDLIDTVVVIDDTSLSKFIVSNFKALFFLIRKRPGVYFDLEIYSDFSTLFTLFSLSKNRVGFYLRSSSFRMGIYTHMMFFNPRVPISEAYLQMVRLLGKKVESKTLYDLSLSLPDKFKNLGEYIVINPNASDLRLERRWGRSNYIELIKSISVNYTDYKIVLIGAKAEKKYVDTIENELIGINLVNLAGSTSLDELFALISNASFMISNDTGPMHVAFSTKTPVVSLFGPCSPDQYGISETAEVIYKDVYCSPCVHDFEIPPCKGDNVCMKLITVGEVMEKISNIVTRNISEVKINKKTVFYWNDKALGKVVR